MKTFYEMWHRVRVGLKAQSVAPIASETELETVARSMFYFGGRSALEVLREGGDPGPEIATFFESIPPQDAPPGAEEKK